MSSDVVLAIVIIAVVITTCCIIKKCCCKSRKQLQKERKKSIKERAIRKQAQQELRKSRENERKTQKKAEKEIKRAHTNEKAMQRKLQQAMKKSSQNIYPQPQPIYIAQQPNPHHIINMNPNIQLPNKQIIHQVTAQQSNKNSTKTIQNQTQTNSQTKDKLPTGWVAKSTRKGKVYYWNNITKKTQWDKPVLLDEYCIPNPSAPIIEDSESEQNYVKKLAGKWIAPKSYDMDAKVALAIELNSGKEGNKLMDSGDNNNVTKQSMETLKQMGFVDENRNAAALRAYKGNLYAVIQYYTFDVNNTTITPGNDEQKQNSVQNSVQNEDEFVEDNIEGVVEGDVIDDNKQENVYKNISESADETIDNPEKECVVCMDKRSVYACIPCGHLCLCEECKGVISDECPICQQKINASNKFIKIYQ